MTTRREQIQEKPQKRHPRRLLAPVIREVQQRPRHEPQKQQRRHPPVPTEKQDQPHNPRCRDEEQPEVMQLATPNSHFLKNSETVNPVLSRVAHTR